MLVNQIIRFSVAGLVAVLIAFASSVVLIYQSVISLGGDAQLASSWILTLGLSMGVTSIALSFYYKVPILIAWSTPGAALLISNTQNFTINQAVGGFIFSASLIFICGITGWFEKLSHRIPAQFASAMLAGILVHFGIEVFNQMNNEPILVISMFLIYLITRQVIPAFTMLIVLIVSLVLAWQLQLVEVNTTSWQLSQFIYIEPEFTLSAMISIGLPLFMVTMAAQNLPGVAVLKSHGYTVPVSSVLSVTGLTNVLTAPFGGYAINLAAITAAICMSDDVDSDPGKRYWASIAAGIFYLLMAICAGYLMEVLSTLPVALIYSLAGIALFSTISSSIQHALSDQRMPEVALMVFLVTASNITLWGINSVLWGLIVGAVMLFIKNNLNCKTLH